MRNDWDFVWTPQFLVGTIVAGLLLNILGAYLVRIVDHMRNRLPAYFRRVREKELVRIQLLSTAAASDSALYAALAAEAGRLQLYQLLAFFVAFICFSILLFLLTVVNVTAAAVTTTERTQMAFVIIVLVSMGGFRYVSGLENGKRARRLDIALRAVQRSRALPIMD